MQIRIKYVLKRCTWINPVEKPDLLHIDENKQRKKQPTNTANSSSSNNNTSYDENEKNEKNRQLLVYSLITNRQIISRPSKTSIFVNRMRFIISI